MQRKRVLVLIIVALVLLIVEGLLLVIARRSDTPTNGIDTAQTSDTLNSNENAQASDILNSNEDAQANDTLNSSDNTQTSDTSSTNSRPGNSISEADYPESTHLTAGLHGTNPTLVKQGDPYIESGAFCIDDRSGIVKNPTISGTVDTSKPGDYPITYTFVTESNDAAKQIERTVRVVPESEFDDKTDGVAVFMYHYVYTSDDVPENLNGNYILDTDLEDQLAWLKENDFYYPSFAELRAFIDGEISLPMKSCILTFDDGQRGFLKYGIPLLEKYEIPAVSFLIVSKDAQGIMTNNPSGYISYESHSYDMHRAGGTIGHGGVISALTKDEIVEDLQTAIDVLGSSQAFAYPYGDYTDDARQAVTEAGILCSFTTEYEWVRIGDDPSALPRVRIVGDAGLEAFKASI